MKKNVNSHEIGILSALAAYVLWGVLPLYWKLLNHVPAKEVLSHRIIWSLILMVVILILLRKVGQFITELKAIVSNKKQLLYMFLASAVISLNWFTYIWSVSNDKLVEASLGYYINPLVSVILAMLIFKEKLTRWQTASFLLAMVGVAIMAINTGGLPIVSLTLAISFAIYSALKKLVTVGALTGLAIETLLITPIAVIYLSIVHTSFTNALYVQSISTFTLLIGAGAATALPLLLFAIGARRIPLATVGFLQYLAPTITLMIGVFLFDEPFKGIHLLAFSFIWTALAIYTLSKTKLIKKIEKNYAPKKHAS